MTMHVRNTEHQEIMEVTQCSILEAPNRLKETWTENSSILYDPNKCISIHNCISIDNSICGFKVYLPLLTNYAYCILVSDFGVCL